MTEQGTPQGGIISPTLCNVALNGLEPQIKRKYKTTKNKIKVIRYADDIVITGKTIETLEKCKETLSEFIAERGLELSETKTRITSINKGINLLGFEIRKAT